MTVMIDGNNVMVIKNNGNNYVFNNNYYNSSNHNDMKINNSLVSRFFGLIKSLILRSYCSVS